MPDPEKTDAEKEAEAKAAAEKKAEEEAAAKAAETDPPKGKDGTPFDPDRAQRAIDAAREAERKAKADAKEAREKAEKYDELTEAQKSDLEKATARAEKAEAQAEKADAKLKRANLIVALADPKNGIVNASAAATLIKGVEFNDEGEPTNLGSPDEDKSLIATFLAENEYLKGTPAKPQAPSTDAKEAAGGDGKPPALTAAELEAAKKSGMSPEEYAQFRPQTDQNGKAQAPVTLAEVEAAQKAQEKDKT